VYLNRVVIDHQGNLEILSLPQRQTARASGNLASNEAESNSSPPQTAPSPQAFHGGFNNLARMDAVNDGGTGKLRGFRLYPGSDSTAFQTAGLQSGDLVLAVNGTPLTDVRRSEELWNKVNSSAGVSLTIERDGRKRRLGVDLTSFAKAAGVDLVARTVDGQTPELPEGPQNAGANPAAID
jgi:general secretion pathway protein C